MAYNYIGLVNDVNRRLNEVELTTANFNTAVGFYSFAKDAVNAAIRHINQEEYEWPWNHIEETEVLEAGVVRYSYPYDAKTVNFNTFRLKGNTTLGVQTRKLKSISYEEYLDKYVDYEYNSSSNNRGAPIYVVRSPNREIIFSPSPDQEYEVVYDYYTLGYDLSKATDVPNFPEPYRYVIIDGAMYYAYQFRGDMQAASFADERFKQGIKNLRSLYINRTDYVRDTRVHF